MVPQGVVPHLGPKNFSGRHRQEVGEHLHNKGRCGWRQTKIPRLFNHPHVENQIRVFTNQSVGVRGNLNNLDVREFASGLDGLDNLSGFAGGAKSQQNGMRPNHADIAVRSLAGVDVDRLNTQRRE